MDQEATMFFHVRYIVHTSGNLFTTIKMEDGGGHYVDPIISVRNVLAIL
jgi:hypothetical protein